MAWKTPAQRQPAQQAKKKNVAANDNFPGLAPSASNAQPTSQLTHYEKVQQDEVMVLRSIYGPDFVQHEVTQSVWKKSEPTFDITIKASSDEEFTITLRVVLVATYPKSPPLLTIKGGSNLRASTMFKVQKFVETQPKAYAAEEQEMIDRIVEGIRDILEDAAQAQAQGLELPSLEEERAAHELALAKLAQDQKDEEERKRQEESKEEERVLGDMLQEELKRQKAKAKESRKKNRTGQLSSEHSVEDVVEADPMLPMLFDQPCKLTDRSGNSVHFTSVADQSIFRSGPITTVFTVKPVVPGRQNLPILVLKQADVNSSGKDAATFKKQLQNLETQLELSKKLRHRNILEILDFKIDRAVSDSLSAGPTTWTISVLSLLAERGPLDELLDLAGTIDVAKIRPWTADLLDGLSFLHNNGVIHQDIHPGNILLVREHGNEIVPKLADAGYQRELHNICAKVQVLTSTSTAKSAYWFPPEIAGAVRPQYSQKTDVWEFGIVFLQMVFGLDVMQKYQSPRELIDSLFLSGALDELLSKFFKADPKKRPRAFELSSSEFLATDAPILAQDESSALSTSWRSIPHSLPTRARRNSTSLTGPSSRYKEDFVEEGRLGKGGFGEVVKARKKLDNQIYAIKKITQKSQATLSEILKEVRLLSQLSHPAVVRYYNTWLEEVPDFSDAEGDISTEDPTAEGSRGTISADLDVDFGPSTGGLDFMSSSGYPHIEFGFDESDNEDAASQNGDDDDSSSDDEPDMAKAGVALPARRHRLPSHRPFRTVLYISMEYCEKLTLRDLISRNVSKNTPEVWRLFRQVLEGLVHIHALSIVHRDLKPENIFISSGPDGADNVKIGDFGLATSGMLASEKGAADANDAGDMTRSIGTAVYVAPEVRSGGTGSYTSKVDMYSLGVIFFEMNHPPMMGMQRAKVLEDLRKPQPTLPTDFKPVDKVVTDIVLSLLTHNPKDRPSSAELLKSGKLPLEMENETIRRALAGIADPSSPYYEKMLSTLFATRVEQAKDYAWDMSSASRGSNELMQRYLVKDTLVSIFRRHGAIEVDRPMLYPRSRHYGPNVVQLLNQNGTLLQLPYDLVMGNARMLARQTSQAAVQTSYCFGDIFRERPDGGQPLVFGEVDFDIVATDTLDLALKEAEAIKVIDEIVAAFPTLLPNQMCFHLGHSDLLSLIFEYCGVEPSARKGAAEVLSKLNIRNFTWQKIRGELRSPVVGVSATSVDELQRFDFRDSQSKAFAKLKAIFEGTDYYQKASSTLAHLKEVYEYAKRLGVATKLYIMPLNSLNAAFFPGGILFSCLSDKKVKDVFAAGGRYDGLIKEHRPRIGGKVVERHAVGFALNWEKLLLPLSGARPTGKAFLKKTEEETQGIFSTKRCDVLVASFDATVLRSAGLEILQALWAHDISAELAKDARTTEDLLAQHRDEAYSWIVIIKPDNMLKIKNLTRKDAPDSDIPRTQLLVWLRGEIREREGRTQAKARTLPALEPTGGGGSSGGFADKDHEQQVRVLVAQTKSKKFNRQTVVEQAQTSAAKLVQSFLDGPIAAIETTDLVMDLIRETALSDLDSWRKVEHTVTTAEKKYVKDIHDMLNSFRSEYQSQSHVGRHAFVYNFRTGNCIYYDLGA